MKTVKINELVKCQKGLNRDMEAYRIALNDRVSAAREYIIKGNICDLENRLELMLGTISSGFAPIKNTRGIIRVVNENGKAKYIIKKGSIRLIKDRCIMNIGKILLTDEQLLILDSFLNSINSDYESSKFIKDMINQLKFVKDTYNTLNTFGFMVKSVIGSVILLKTEALSNKNFNELKRECRVNKIDFGSLCNNENLLIAL